MSEKYIFSNVLVYTVQCFVQFHKSNNDMRYVCQKSKLFNKLFLIGYKLVASSARNFFLFFFLSIVEKFAW